MSEYFIGLMSGTSIDGIDAALVDFSVFPPKLVASAETAIEPELKNQILTLCQSGKNEIEQMGQLDVALGRTFAEATQHVLEKSGIPTEKITAIGSHGQTIRHLPHGKFPFTLQIGDPNIIAAETGITTVADFRRRDIALGGQGAPLAPAYHAWLFAEKRGIMLNIGGMANITVLDGSDQPERILGFDTGPGNVLMDLWVQKHLGTPMDRNGEYAQSGTIDAPLLEKMLDDPFFVQSPPKSTGREQFHAAWLEQQLADKDLQNRTQKDVQATLCELTARSIAQAILRWSNLENESVWICGGGAHNAYLMSRLAENLPGWTVASTAAVGVDPDWMEAMAFAWLARRTLRDETGNLPAVTGAHRATVLGAIYPV